MSFPLGRLLALNPVRFAFDHDGPQPGQCIHAQGEELIGRVLKEARERLVLDDPKELLDRRRSGVDGGDHLASLALVPLRRVSEHQRPPRFRWRRAEPVSPDG